MQVRALRSRLAARGSIVGHSGLQPLLQRHRVNAGVLRDPLDPHTRFTVRRDANDVATELLRIEKGTMPSLQAIPPGKLDQISPIPAEDFLY